MNKKFLNSIKLVLLQNQIIGFVTFSASDEKFRPSKFRNTINILTTILVLSTTTYGIFVLIESNQSKINKTTNIILIITYTVFLATTWFCGITKSPKIASLLNQLINLDKKFHNFGFSIDYARTKKHVLWEFLARNLLMVILIWAIVTYTNIDDPEFAISESIYVIFVATKSAICFLSVTLISMFKTRFKILNGYIDGLSKNSSKNRFLLISLCRSCDLHHSLYKFVKQFNDAFGLILLFVFGASFVYIVIAAFFVASNLQAEEIAWNNVISLAVACTPFIIDVVYVCSVCYTAVDEVRRRLLI